MPINSINISGCDFEDKNSSPNFVSEINNSSKEEYQNCYILLNDYKIKSN